MSRRGEDWCEDPGWKKTKDKKGGRDTLLEGGGFSLKRTRLPEKSAKEERNPTKGPKRTLLRRVEKVSIRNTPISGTKKE